MKADTAYNSARYDCHSLDSLQGNRYSVEASKLSLIIVLFRVYGGKLLLYLRRFCAVQLFRIIEDFFCFFYPR